MNVAKNSPIPFEMQDGYAVFRASGPVTLEQGVEIVDAALAAAREQKIRKLLLDVAGFSGFAPPNLAERFFFVRRWAATARGAVTVVVVTQPEMIDPEKFGVQVALNCGLNCDVFPTEAEAIAWLQTAKS